MGDNCPGKANITSRAPNRWSFSQSGVVKMERESRRPRQNSMPHCAFEGPAEERVGRRDGRGGDDDDGSSVEGRVCVDRNPSTKSLWESMPSTSLPSALDTGPVMSVHSISANACSSSSQISDIIALCWSISREFSMDDFGGTRCTGGSVRVSVELDWARLEPRAVL